MLKPDQKLFLDENNSGYTSMYLRLYCSQVRKRTKTIKFLVIPRNVVLPYVHTCTRRIRSRFVFLNVFLGSKKKLRHVRFGTLYSGRPSELYSGINQGFICVCVCHSTFWVFHILAHHKPWHLFLKASNDF